MHFVKNTDTADVLDHMTPPLILIQELLNHNL